MLKNRVAWDKSRRLCSNPLILDVETSTSCINEPRRLQTIPSFPFRSLSLQNLHRGNLELDKNIIFLSSVRDSGLSVSSERLTTVRCDNAYPSRKQECFSLFHLLLILSFLLEKSLLPSQLNSFSQLLELEVTITSSLVCPVFSMRPLLQLYSKCDVLSYWFLTGFLKLQLLVFQVSE